MLTIYIMIIIVCIIAPLVWGALDAKKHGYWDGAGVALWYMISSIVLACVLGLSTPLIQFNTGEKTYTGYIYSAEDSWDRIVGHIRFSEYAGKDEQPEFCAIKGSSEAKKIKDLAGSGKKVRVSVPAGLHIQMWYGQCGLPATIEEMDE